MSEPLCTPTKRVLADRRKAPLSECEGAFWAFSQRVFTNVCPAHRDEAAYRGGNRPRGDRDRGAEKGVRSLLPMRGGGFSRDSDHNNAVALKNYLES